MESVKDSSSEREGDVGACRTVGDVDENIVASYVDAFEI